MTFTRPHAAKRLFRRPLLSILAVAPLLAGLSVSAEASADSSYALFESGQVRPVALSPNKQFLFAVNTPDNRLEIFHVEPNGSLSHRGSVPVGLEPVAVAARSNDEIWVVNHLSDSVSVVKIGPFGYQGNVVRTLLVGDEPRDIVFGGPGKNRAFITTAHRGQNVPYDPQLTTPGVGRADVWVFDAGNLGTTLGGTPQTIVTLFSDSPRALAVSPDGSRVYAAAFHSGNRTAALSELQVPDGGEAAGGVPGPNTNADGVPAPEVGIIVKHDGEHWRDVIGRSWDSGVRFSLPDKDVFVIDANANPPAQLSGSSGYYTGVGTILYNMAVNPVSGKVYVSNTEARNDLRFEGPGIYAGETLRGHLHESRITVLGTGAPAPRHLNKHIDYDVYPAPAAVNQKTLSQPLGMVVSSDGTKLYVAAFASSKIGVYDTAALENDTFVPSTANQIELSGGGPTGMVLDESCGRMYVLTRFDNSIAIVDTTTKTEIGHVSMHSPEPESVIEGRAFLYDARLSSSNGESACGSCHVFGDLDSLAWDLGNPDGVVLNNPGPFVPIKPELVPVFGTDDPTFGQNPDFHPMKGPMTTQSLRGMANHGPMHWRGDRTGGNDEASSQPDDGSFDEEAAFKKFNGAFVDLLGRDATLSTEQMQKFTDFVLQVMYPPNPVRNLDNSLTPTQQAGRDFFFTQNVASQGSCEACHRVDPEANPSDAFPGFFGTAGFGSFDATTQILKVPHLRNAYSKVGMFGAGFTSGNRVPDPFLGDQVRGFGFNHDGTVPELFTFVSGFDLVPANPAGIPNTPAGNQAKLDMVEYQLAFESNLAPIVGQQVTLTQSNQTVTSPRIDLLVARTDAGECDLVVKGRLVNEIGLVYIGSGQFLADRASVAPVTRAQLESVLTANGKALTYTCAPPGSGVRMGIDRDLDGFLDGDEQVAGSDPADPTSTP
ncbi:beta-propeller fold lactonase family protein [Polyangium sp. 15x6]|uniref:beta-propeller fold lactonase family protein n=1 Tax=Polyangium sp. 15x6 TaxID=3042687 RepID=UPI00249A26C2|nr:beta-propeller fold lactonase family protein [Polyangium sp. 15x6]MDI3288559.1 beta-propeller fold lactonase family protein [Polyangium sp. 15x6]